LQTLLIAHNRIQSIGRDIELEESIEISKLNEISGNEYSDFIDKSDYDPVLEKIENFIELEEKRDDERRLKNEFVFCFNHEKFNSLSKKFNRNLLHNLKEKLSNSSDDCSVYNRYAYLFKYYYYDIKNNSIKSFDESFFNNYAKLMNISQNNNLIHLSNSENYIHNSDIDFLYMKNIPTPPLGVSPTLLSPGTSDIPVSSNFRVVGDPDMKLELFSCPCSPYSVSVISSFFPSLFNVRHFASLSRLDLSFNKLRRLPLHILFSVFYLFIHIYLFFIITIVL
jgi:hypothetical protein